MTERSIIMHGQIVLSTKGLTMHRVHFSSWLKTVSTFTLSGFNKGRVAAGKSIQPHMTVTPLHQSIFMLAQHKKRGVVVRFTQSCKWVDICKRSYFVQHLKMLPATMKALVKSKPGVSYTYEDVPVPSPQGDELLVKVGKVALCGSDIALYQWNEGETQRNKLNS